MAGVNDALGLILRRSEWPFFSDSWRGPKCQDALVSGSAPLRSAASPRADWRGQVRRYLSSAERDCNVRQHLACPDRPLRDGVVMAATVPRAHREPGRAHRAMGVCCWPGDTNETRYVPIMTWHVGYTWPGKHSATHDVTRFSALLHSMAIPRAIHSSSHSTGTPLLIPLCGTFFYLDLDYSLCLLLVALQWHSGLSRCGKYKL